MSRPAYSLVIPAFNAADTLAEAIASARAQTEKPAEIIVVDDGSTDATADIAQAAGARVIRQANAGPGAATTRGLAEVATPLVATLDADDLWLAGKCGRQVDLLLARPEIAAVFTQYAQFKSGEAPQASARDGWIRTTMMVRTEIALATGPIIDPPGFTGDMVDWLARMGEAGHRREMIGEVLALRRIRPGSLTYNRKAENDAGYMFVVREAMKRRKAREAAEKTRK